MMMFFQPVHKGSNSQCGFFEDLAVVLGARIDSTVSGHLTLRPPLLTMGCGSDAPFPDPRFPAGQLPPSRLRTPRYPARLQ